MSGSQGRRDKTHIWWRNYFRANRTPCWEPGCTQPSTIADHDPPLHLFNYDPTAWRAAGGVYRPHCRYHSCKQGADITNNANQRRRW